MIYRFKKLYNHWQALIISIAMAYYFRLPSRGEKLIVTSAEKPVPEEFDRESFMNKMNHRLAQQACPQSLIFRETLQGLLIKFYNETLIPGMKHTHATLDRCGANNSVF